MVSFVFDGHNHAMATVYQQFSVRIDPIPCMAFLRHHKGHEPLPHTFFIVHITYFQFFETKQNNEPTS